MAVIKNLLKAGGEPAHEGCMLFQPHIIQFRQAFLNKMESLGLKSDPEKDAEMKLEHLGLIDLIGLATASYSAPIQENSWQPARHSADTSVVPRRFASSANTLIQSNGPVQDGGGTQGTCYNCGGQGHFSHECPSRRERPQGHSQGRGAHNGRGIGRGGRHTGRGGRGTHQGAGRRPPRCLSPSAERRQAPRDGTPGTVGWRRVPPGNGPNSKCLEPDCVAGQVPLPAAGIRPRGVPTEAAVRRGKEKGIFPQAQPFGRVADNKARVRGWALSSARACPPRRRPSPASPRNPCRRGRG
jgi:hypothetical protein